MNKTAASVAQLAKRILLHAFSRTTVKFPAAQEQTKTSYSFNKLAFITVLLVIN